MYHFAVEHLFITFWHFWTANVPKEIHILGEWHIFYSWIIYLQGPPLSLFVVNKMLTKCGNAKHFFHKFKKKILFEYIFFVKKIWMGEMKFVFLVISCKQIKILSWISRTNVRAYIFSFRNYFTLFSHASNVKKWPLESQGSRHACPVTGPANTY